MTYRPIPMQPDQHRAEVLTLWTQNMSDARIAEVADSRFDWYYDRNPEGRPTTTLLMDGDSSQAVGCGSFFLRKIVVDGEVLRIGIMSDFAVSSAHRAAGPAIAIQRFLAEASRDAGADFLATYPNRPAEPIFKRVGYQSVGKSSRWVKPLRPRKEIGRRFSNPVIAAAAGGVVGASLAALDVSRIARLPSPLRRLRGVYLDCADARFDALWARTRTAHRITGERSSAYLNWRYRDFPSVQYRFFGLLDPAGERLSAYLTYFVNAQNASVIGDLFGEPSEGVMEALLLRFSTGQRRAGRESVCMDYLGLDSIGERLSRIGFYSRPAERSLLVHLNPAFPERLKSVVLDKSNWFTLDAEMDI